LAAFAGPGGGITNSTIICWTAISALITVVFEKDGLHNGPSILSQAMLLSRWMLWAGLVLALVSIIGFFLYQKWKRDNHDA
jgi:multisubunit Na+/H+ antiporter MnhB subunit